MREKVGASPLSILLPWLLPLARAIVAIMGRRCEVVIHDLTGNAPVNSTIIAVEGSVTGRQVGGPPTDYLLRRLRAGGDLAELQDYDVYPGRTTDGRPLRSATVLLRDGTGRVMGALCINVEVTDLLMARTVLDDLCQGAVQRGLQVSPGETLAKDLGQTFDSILEGALTEIAKPIAYMDKPDRVRLVGLIDKRGGFLLRGTPERLAKALGVSRYTVYNYLNESKQADPLAVD